MSHSGFNVFPDPCATSQLIFAFYQNLYPWPLLEQATPLSAVVLLFGLEFPGLFIYLVCVALTLQPISLVAQPGFEKGMPSCSGMVVAKCYGTLSSRQPLWQQQCLTQQRLSGNGEEVLLKLKCPQAEFLKVPMIFIYLVQM